MRHRTSMVMGCCVLALSITACAPSSSRPGQSRSQQGAGTGQVAPATAPSADQSRTPVVAGQLKGAVTSKQLDGIENGMTYEQVAKVFGAPGTELSRGGSGTHTVIAYGWHSQDEGFEVSVTFVAGKVAGYERTQLPK